MFHTVDTLSEVFRHEAIHDLAIAPKDDNGGLPLRFTPFPRRESLS
jgi:hypothetical protein